MAYKHLFSKLKYILPCAAACLLCLFSCQSSTSDKVLSKPKMVSIIIDLCSYDAAIDVTSLGSQSPRPALADYEAIYASHGASRRQFCWNLIYYQDREELELLYQSAVDSLEQAKTMLTATPKKTTTK